jgi:apolipoprotein N-acyltransferase
VSLVSEVRRVGSGLPAFAHKVGALRGVRRIALSLALGVALAATMPPVHALPLLPVALTGLIWLIAGSRSGASAFATGFWFGLGFFLAGLYWIGFALMTDPDRYAWLVAPGVIGIAGGLALFPAFGCLILRLLKLDGVWNVLAFTVIWSGLEWLRGHVLTGFPWNLVGSAFSLSDGMNQLSALVGAYGLSLVVVFACALPATLAAPSGPARRYALPAMTAILFAVWLGGTVRLALAPEPAADGPRLRIVQPNIAQELKWRGDMQAEILARHLGLTMAPAAEPADLVIWPEAAVPFVIDEDPAVRVHLGQALPETALLITGAPRRSRDADGHPQVWNSLHVIAADGRLITRYDKHHLVPFGEFVPLRNLLGLNKITPGTLDFSRGPGAKTLELPGLPPVAPSICYEAIFPGGVAPEDGMRPSWLLNLTNDGWFGITSGPYQHLASARLRAVEEGLPLIRAANTGISAVIDPYGRVLQRLPLDRDGIIDARLPAPLSGAPVYARVGDWPVGAILLLGVLAVALRLVRLRWAPREKSRK